MIDDPYCKLETKMHSFLKIKKAARVSRQPCNVIGIVGDY